MVKVKSKIRSTSTTIFVLLMIMAVMVLISTIDSTCALLSDWQNNIEDDKMMQESFSDLISLFRRYCLITLIVFTSFIFRKISVNETPFIEAVPKRLKLSAVIFFLAIAIPQWLGYILFSIKNNTGRFTVFDNQTSIAFIISGVIYCLAQIFDYGYLIQDENNEIL